MANNDTEKAVNVLGGLQNELTQAMVDIVTKHLQELGEVNAGLFEISSLMGQASVIAIFRLFPKALQTTLVSDERSSKLFTQLVKHLQDNASRQEKMLRVQAASRPVPTPDSADLSSPT